MGSKMAVAFANIFMGEIEKQMLNESAHKPLTWKRYIDNIIFLSYTSREVSISISIQQSDLRPRYHVQMRLS